MKIVNDREWIIILTLWLALAIPVAGIASEVQEKQGVVQNSDKANKKSSVPDKKPAADKKLIYNPPLRGAPLGRVGGGTRGPGDVSPEIFPLVPDHVGLTVKEQPSLYWFLSEQTPYPMEFTLIEYQGIQPLIEQRISSPQQPGIQKIQISDYNLRLSSGVRYQWFVSLVADPEHRSRDIIAGGAIEHIEIAADLGDRLAHADKGELPFIYAGDGIWYDALQAISDLIEASPDNADLKQLRASLLEQAGVPPHMGQGSALRVPRWK